MVDTLITRIFSLPIFVHSICGRGVLYFFAFLEIGIFPTIQKKIECPPQHSNCCDAGSIVVERYVYKTNRQKWTKKKKEATNPNSYIFNPTPWWRFRNRTEKTKRKVGQKKENESIVWWDSEHCFWQLQNKKRATASMTQRGSPLSQPTPVFNKPP